MFKRTSLLLVLASSACTSTGSDDIWMPQGGEGGKADGYTTVKGSDIPSAYVDPNKYYIIKRQIGSLTTVGALDADETTLAKRVDGIIANMPADGAMHLAELVRMEDPTIHASLFPGEQAALPKVWKIMQAPDAHDLLAGPTDNFAALDTSTQPAAAVPPANLAIASLSSDLQAPAQRLENLYNSDGITSTVTLADLAMGVANPGSFTPDEVTAFGKIQAVFRTQAVAYGVARLSVSPGPGPFTYDGTLGAVGFHVAGKMSLSEERSVWSNETSMTTSFTATQSTSATASPPTGGQVLVLSQDSGNEATFGQGAVPSFPAGTYVFEVWQAGQRTFSSNASLPAMTTTQTIDLHDKLDYALASGLNILARNVVSATATQSSSYPYPTTYDVQYSYDKAASPMPANASQPAFAATNSPAVTLPVGRYSFPQQGVILYVYAGNILWVSVNGSLARMLPMGNRGSAPNMFETSTSPYVTFTASNNQLNCSNSGCSISVTLDGSMRDI
jgi:hypothetical protein